MDVPQFGNKDQEISYWKNLADQYLKEKIDAQQELDDFTEGSGQLERELEASLLQSDRIIKDLKSTNRNLQSELESTRNKLDNAQKDWCSLESSYKSLASDKDKLVNYIRELEQKNDDLERAHRIVTESVASFEDLLNKAYEKNAMLENEVGEKDNLQVQLQRLRDEARDLKQELNVKTTSTVIDQSNNIDTNKSPLMLTNGGHNNTSTSTIMMDSNRLMDRNCDMDTTTQMGNTPIKHLNGNTLTPAGRISAMNIVGDLLRKVGFAKLLCPVCSRVTCTCVKVSTNTDNKGLNTNKNTELNTNKGLNTDKNTELNTDNNPNTVNKGLYTNKNTELNTDNNKSNTVNKELNTDNNELNTAELNLIKQSVAMNNSRSESLNTLNDNVTMQSNSSLNSFNQNNTLNDSVVQNNSSLNSFNSFNSLFTNRTETNRFQVWLNNLVNSKNTTSNSDNNSDDNK